MMVGRGGDGGRWKQVKKVTNINSNFLDVWSYHSRFLYLYVIPALTIIYWL